MKKLLALLFFCAGIALAQNPNPIQTVTTAPSGSCGSNGVRLLTPNGTIYTCQSGMWAPVSGGGGSGCVPVGAASQILVSDGAGGCTEATPTISGSTITASLTGAASLNLLKSNNLSDLASAATARTNLGLSVLATTVPGTGVATALANAVDTSGGVCTVGGGGCPAGTGTVTVVGGGSLTSTAIATGGGTTTIQTPSATATLDTSGNISTPGSVTTGAGTGAAGFVDMGAGTAHTATGVGFQAPTSVTTPFMMTLPALPATGFMLNTGTTDPSVISYVASSGSGNVCLTTNCVMTTPNLGTPSAATLTNATGLPLAGLATQAADTLVMNMTGSTASPTAAAMPTCTTGADLYNTSTHTWSCVSTGGGSNPFITPIVLGNWSNIGSVGTTCTKSTVVGPTGGDAIAIVGTSTGGLCGVQIPMSGTFSHTFGVALEFMGGGTGFGLNIGFTDGTKWEACGVQGNTANNLAVTAISGGTYAAANGSTNISSQLGPIVYFKLERSGTTLKCSYSSDGNFVAGTTINDTVPFLTPSAIFVGTDSRGSTATTFTFFSYQ